MEANSKSDKTLIMIFNYNCDTADILDLLRVDTKFRDTKVREISQFFDFANNFHIYFAKDGHEIRNEFLVGNFVSRNFVSTLLPHSQGCFRRNPGNTGVQHGLVVILGAG
jgi:hypothetical protein